MAYNNVHPRLSVFSTGSQSSLDYIPSAGTPPPGSAGRQSVTPIPKAGPSKGIYDRPLNKTRNTEVSAAAYAFLFSEMIQYTQKRVHGIGDLEKRLSLLGYRIGTRTLELMIWRNEGNSKNPKRETRLLPVLYVVHTQLWKAIFGKTADAIEKSVENDDEYMIIDNDPPITKYISIPKEMSQLSCSALTAGIVEALLDGLGFPARVTAHSVPKEGFPLRTTILIKLDRSVMEREEALK
ncbi:TRAPP complex subunit trs31 [Calocera viscosa TUFC12733]|uniref:Trafficking protein particle complex subunit n=1 Tax=Calocera viscosa (strain TUFC12733) TaxID=1330018 RepID=A0A167QJD1_CALVF|nr:TRAPP complex subunit trs31 [Calocera viscosa TUFC12733]